MANKKQVHYNLDNIDKVRCKIQFNLWGKV